MTQKRRLAWALALLFVVNIAVISLAQQAEAATYRQGSSGEQVRIIQTKLKNWGYYDGAVDGIYGSQTAQAVKPGTYAAVIAGEIIDHRPLAAARGH